MERPSFSTGHLIRAALQRAGGDGLATCQLVDQHGDDESHSEEGKVPVVATYPGDVRAGRVLVPTTLVLHPSQ